MVSQLTPPLPTECLEAIVNHVCDCGTLFSLLTVNRAFFNLAVRSLYHTPFHWTDRDPRHNRCSRLLRHVLQFSSAKDEDTERLRQLWGCPTSSAGAGPSSSMADYFSYVRSLFYYPRHYTNSFHNEGAITTLADDHFEGKWFYAMCNLQKTMLWLLCEPHMERVQRLHIPLWDIDRYEQAIPRMRCVEEIVFDVTTGYVAGFESVEVGYIERAVEFTKKFLLHYQPSFSSASTLSSSSAAAETPSSSLSPLAHASDIGYTRRLDISFENSSSSGGNRKQIQQLQLDLYRLMPPIHEPRILDEKNWLRFLTHPLETDLSRLTLLNLKGRQRAWRQLTTSPSLSSSSSSKQQVRPASLLERSRNLRSLFTWLPYGNEREQLFSWAAREKNLALDQEEAVQCDVENGGTCLPQQQLDSHRSQLVQIRELGVQCRGVGGLQTLQDAMHGFGHSLRAAEFYGLSIDGREDGAEDAYGTDDDSDVNDHPAPISVQKDSCTNAHEHERQFIGEDWRLPYLSDLTVNSDKALPLADQALDHAHNLLHLHLSDAVPEYSLSSGEWRRLRAWTSLTSLTNLDLMGQIATEFHPASFQHMPSLEELTLRGPGFGRFCCSPSYRRYTLPLVSSSGSKSSLDGQDRSSTTTPASPNMHHRHLHDSDLWTWDWTMPNLRSITLEGEPACRFDLKWLRYCPKLISLCIRVRGHRRPLTMDALLEDLAKNNLCPPQPSRTALAAADDQAEEKNRDGILFTSSLTHCHIMGRFSIRDADLLSLLAICPAMTHLTLEQATHYSLSTLLAATAGDAHPALKRVELSRQVNLKDCSRLNLVRSERGLFAGHLDRTLDPDSEEYRAQVTADVCQPDYRFMNGCFVVAPTQIDEDEEGEEEEEESEKVVTDEHNIEEEPNWLFETCSEIFV
ncbi:hypothetical protein BGZ73_004108 [Actinomortierella ambigua]|nr:hypothetical protein BGZ73_004108 [Actinomortierella ambigua]